MIWMTWRAFCARPYSLAVRAPHEKHRSLFQPSNLEACRTHKFRIDGAFRIDRLFNSRISAQNLRLLLIDQFQLACIVYRNRPSRVKRQDLGPSNRLEPPSGRPTSRS